VSRTASLYKSPPRDGIWSGNVGIHSRTLAHIRLFCPSLIEGPTCSLPLSPPSSLSSALRSLSTHGSASRARARSCRSGVCPFITCRRRFSCLHPSVDPIINPGMHRLRILALLITIFSGISPSYHVHTVHGGSNFNPTYSYNNSRASSCTSCEIAQVGQAPL
jgi:hypothetical protein